MNYALLDENNIVVNIIWINPEHQDRFPNGVSMNDLQILPGDEYKDGKFYRNGIEITPESPSPEPENRYTLDEAATILAQEVSA